MRRAVRVGRQILLSRIRTQGKTGISKCGSGIQHKRLGGWRPKTKTLYLPFQRLRYIGMAARGVLSSLPFSPINLDKGPSTAAMVVELSVCQQLPHCQLANLDRWTGEIALSRELGALEGPVLSDVSFEGSAIIRAGGVDTPIAAGHTKYGTDEMDFDPVCVDDCRTVVCRAQDRGGECTGYARQLGDRGCARTGLLVRMGGVHTACDWSGQTVPVDGAEVCTSYSDPHNHVAHDGSSGICHRILSGPWTSAVSFSHN